MKRIKLVGLSSALLIISMNVSANIGANEQNDSGLGISVNVSPLLGIIGIFDADVSIDVSDNITFGPTFSYGNFEFMWDEIVILALGVRGEYAFNGVNQNGVYGSVEMNYRMVGVGDNSEFPLNDVTSKCSGRMIAANTFAGYAWRKQKGLIVRLAAGLVQTGILPDNPSCDVESTIDTATETEFINYFGFNMTVGWKM
ncbi:MAG: hypothetical protein HRU38_14105 [Saccharospirillaceae bacterium]|nr:hypothetical protein [Pseudomonadales bacterium]NRB79778.1 hypothetical protein [Saccharospirillaceae bacterium]